jgi:hypothetical protein
MRIRGLAFPFQEDNETCHLFNALRYIYDSARNVTQNVAAAFQSLTRAAETVNLHT